MKKILISLITCTSISLMGMSNQKQVIPMPAPAYTHNDVNSMFKTVEIQEAAVISHMPKPLALQTSKSENCFVCIMGCLGWPVAVAGDILCSPCDATGYHCNKCPGVSDKPVCCPLTQAACNGATCGNCGKDLGDHDPVYFNTRD